MRNLLTIAGLALLATACGGTKAGTSTGTSTGTTSSGTTSGGTTGGSTTGGTTTGGVTDAGPSAGSPCTENDGCASKICGTDGTGYCCSIACNMSDAGCGAVGCDSTGTCVYPAQDAGAIECGGTCASAKFTLLYCDTAGGCSVSTGQKLPCAGNFACNRAGDGCDTTCSTLADCAPGYTCVGKACIAQLATGPCDDDDACLSLACGVSGGPGDCCTKACQPTLDISCNATGCNATSGACVYPNGSLCGGPSCVNSAVSSGGICDAYGNCVTKPVACPNHLGCDPTRTACNTSCATVTDCASGYYCDNDAGGCIPQTVFGPCSENDQCTSLFCGLSGTGNCCNTTCPSTDATCAAPGCSPANGDCEYPDASIPCGTTLESCAKGVQQNPSVCDGLGDCPVPGVTPCTPFICGMNACLTTCTDATSCVAGAFCDTADSSCCNGGAAGLGNGGTITVDAANGDDATGCCGFGGASACKTIGHAMKLIDEAKASNVTINASIMGGGGNWPKGETYPIVLGWGVELSAGNVFFYDPNGGNGEIFDITAYSANDTVGSASIVGGAKALVSVGMNSGDTVQSTDSSSIQVEAGNTLYLANASVNGSASNKTNAITVIGGATLTLGQDSSATITGTVTVGNAGSSASTDGWNGIVCTSAKSQGCTITDAKLKATSSVVIEAQENLDLDAEDFAKITLTSAPVIGVPPSSAGYRNCPHKDDGVSTFKSSGSAEAVLLNGDVTMTFSNGTVQCISGDGFLLQASSNGVPTLTLDSTTIQNTEYALFATAGKATVSGSTIQYNYNGVQQGTDGTNTATVDLNGGAAAENTIVCANSVESVNGANGESLTPAVCVLNTTTANLDASNTEWDTASPDQFSCDASLTSCTCESANCADPGGFDGMDAVYDSSGTVTTKGNGKSKADLLPFPCDSSVCSRFVRSTVPA